MKYENVCIHNLDLTGLSSNQGAAGQQSAGGGNPMAGMAGLNIGALPMNPALVAAALNQAGWGLIGNLGAGGGGPGGGPAGPGAETHGAFPTPTSFSTHGNVTTTPVWIANFIVIVVLSMNICINNLCNRIRKQYLKHKTFMGLDWS